MGYAKRIISRDKDGKLFKFEFYTCSDEMGENEVQYKSYKDYQANCGSIKIKTEYIKDSEEKKLISKSILQVQGVRFEMEWFEDSLLNFDHGSIERHLSKRYGQTSLNININGNPIRETFFGLDESDGLIGNITTQYNYAGEKVFRYRGENLIVKLYWNTQIGKKIDSTTYKKFKDKLSRRNGIEFRLKDSNKDWPSVLLMSNTNIIFGEQKKGFIFGNGKELGKYSSNMGNLQIVVKFESQIKHHLASNKSNGFTDDNFSKKFGNYISKWISDDNIKPKYYDWSRKLEDNEMKQMIQKIIEPNSVVEKELRRMTNSTKKILNNKDNWKYVGEDSNNQSNTNVTINGVTRQMDAINELAGVIWEHERGDSDIKHKDFLESNVTNWCRNQTWIKYIFWSAKKHGYKQRFITTLRTYKWENPSLERIYLIKTDDILRDTLDEDDVDYIDIKKDILENKSNA